MSDQQQGDTGIDQPMGASPSFISNPLMRQEAQRAMIWAVVAGLVILAVYVSQSLLVIFGALVFAAIIDGGARLIGKVLPIGRMWRIALVLLLAVAFFVWLTYYAGSQIAQQAAALPDIVQTQTSRLVQFARENGLSVQAQDLQSYSSQLMSGVGTVTAALTGLVGGLTTVVLILIIGVYVALEPNLYERGLEWMAPRHRRSSLSVTMDRMAQTMRRLMAGRLLGMFVEGVFTYIALSILGVPMAALLGILTGLLAFIPNIGAVVSGLLMALVGFSVDMQTGIYAIAVYFFVQTFDGYVVVPMIAKKTVDLAPALVLGMQLIMGILFGILGLFLADPLLAMIKVMLERRAEETDAEERAARDAERLLDHTPVANEPPAHGA
ncbi:AI-2E family transporter [Erythrobacter sp. LQ02-29]|uniref:AI-2E family transporter n=1 Tax=Erythrobacter sp. LQ02-29 TaxID=2920384 RepID=UPI001F4D4D8D|nr:AI-2E family transporter [Erythrobacter sp. LQ02-29]MCP9223768.1 AI-2E family transporter [Erythrobacter sp. LQ02-29]